MRVVQKRFSRVIYWEMFGDNIHLHVWGYGMGTWYAGAGYYNVKEVEKLFDSGLL